MQSQPNIIWIVSDHQALGGRDRIAQSFDLQRFLAASGMTFQRAYTVLPICSPARASMLTGLYPHNHGLTENDGRFGGRTGLDSSDYMIQHSLKDAGYRCGWFGKWHLNIDSDASAFGYEGFSLPSYGYPYGTEAYKAYLDENGLSDPVVRIVMGGESGLPEGTEINLVEAPDWFDYEAGVAVFEGDAAYHESRFITSLAEKWVDGIDEEPFFVRIDPWGPHPPYTLAAPYFDSLSDETIGLSENYYHDLKDRPQHHKDYQSYWRDTLDYDETHWRRLQQHALEHVALIENALFRFLQSLRSKGKLENTYIMFCADHGDAVASNGGVSNKGSLMVEETMKIPLLVSGPGIPAGTVRKELASNMDLAPTILELCGVAGPPAMDGVSLVPLLKQQACFWRDGFVAQNYGLHAPDLQRSYHRDNWKLVVQKDGFRELYDLGKDPSECDNLAMKEEFRGILNQLLTELRTSMAETGDDDPKLSGILNG